MAKLRTEEFLVNMGPHHPSTHGVCRLVLTMDGEKVVHIEPVIGYLHRAIEKICENRTYPQCSPMMDRFEYVTAMASDHVYALAVEKLAGLEVPERAEYLRVIMVELNRIASHLIFWGVTAMDVGAYTPFLYGLREREDIIDLFEMTCGQRLTYNYIRIGGVSQDIPDEFVPKCREFMDKLWGKFADYEGLLNENPIWLVRTKGIGVLTAEKAIAFGASGPVLRASGVDYDVRRDDPYSIYDKFNFEIPTQKNGDSYDRFIQRIDEMKASLRIIEQALDNLPEGDIKCKVKPKFKPPAGEVYSRIESARGEMGVYIRSDGSTKPVRVKLRGSSYNHLRLVPEIATDVLIADLVTIFATLDIIMPEVDR
ncbi:MAG: NADH-quinone oxidoreductase subunit D [candidate division Zixibacteria bacterium]|nr:NADH-quinone oxidoreductase subunit D [candidate division Zixibacteria bacterium]MDH3938028.1 NADH-quinone oxidoreductase subunit D [candidate division Zixibacteria bacterium]MDH4033910.1 NADH-quinone oxidoreductase subunit D [candidate division Zixibacteria bacterium]